MIVTATEFKSNIGRYLTLSDKEDIFITKNGKVTAALVNPKEKTKYLTDSLRGIIKGADVTLESVREERRMKYLENYD
jgi:antitoxin (DNA-binding transcriptional repressor) of toxin-antitoxin stability system